MQRPAAAAAATAAGSLSLTVFCVGTMDAHLLEDRWVRNGKPKAFSK